MWREKLLQEQIELDTTDFEDLGKKAQDPVGSGSSHLALWFMKEN